jgi:hypothetical protein
VIAIVIKDELYALVKNPPNAEKMWEIIPVYKGNTKKRPLDILWTHFEFE